VTVRLTHEPLSVSLAYRELSDGPNGGIALFVGRVRPDRSRAGTVVALDYEADDRMALESLTRLERMARRRYGAQRTVVHHRLGRLKVGAVSVIVGAAAPHRDAAFEAARFLIERLKVEVPIWKSDRVRSARRRPRRPRGRGGRSAD
jgi:molybdopterin synthase catalytic subunit